MSSARIARYRSGLRAERLAEFYLIAKAYLPITRRYKTPYGEIDLIVRRGKTLVFVEVKARKTFEEGAESIHARTQMRIRNAARAFLSTHPEYLEHQMRFDAIIIAWYRWPRHITHAFT